MTDQKTQHASSASRLSDGLADEPIYVSCPFCGEEDYDLIGLKMHFLNGWCDEFNDLKLKITG